MGFSSMYVGFNRDTMEQTEKNVQILKENGLPNDIDRRTKGTVTPINNQGQCGFYW